MVSYGIKNRRNAPQRKKYKQNQKTILSASSANGGKTGITHKSFGDHVLDAWYYWFVWQPNYGTTIKATFSVKFCSTTNFSKGETINEP